MLSLDMIMQYLKLCITLYHTVLKLNLMLKYGQFDGKILGTFYEIHNKNRVEYLFPIRLTLKIMLLKPGNFVSSL